MKKSIFLALIASLPLMAQETAPAPEQAPAPGFQNHRAAMLEKYDVDKDGKLSDEERAAMRQDFHNKMLEKFDADKDGKLSDEERAAMREEFRKNHPQGPRGHWGEGRGQRPEGAHRGPRPEGPRGNWGKPGPRPIPAEILEKFDTDKDGKLNDEERAAMREEFRKNHPQGPRGHWGEGRGQRPEGAHRGPRPEGPRGHWGEGRGQRPEGGHRGHRGERGFRPEAPCGDRPTPYNQQPEA